MAAEALSTRGVAGTVGDDVQNLADLDDMLESVAFQETKRPHLPDDGTRLEGNEIMGADNPAYPNESRHWKGYARVPTDGGLKYLYGPLGVLLWAGYNSRQHFFIVGKSVKWQPCIAAMKKCNNCHSTYPATCAFCAHCGQHLPSLQNTQPAKQCETCKLVYAAAFNNCSRCGVILSVMM